MPIRSADTYLKQETYLLIIKKYAKTENILLQN